MIRTSDLQGRHRWVIELTNAWLRLFRRLTIRIEPNSLVYLSYSTIALIIILIYVFIIAVSMRSGS